MKDPELADAPEHPDAIAWEVRHCADRLASLAELAWETTTDSTVALLHETAENARDAADWLDGVWRYPPPVDAPWRRGGQR